MTMTMTMTEIRPYRVTKMVVGVLARWCKEVGVSPFAVDVFLLVVGGKGGVVMMMLVGLACGPSQ